MQRFLRLSSAATLAIVLVASLAGCLGLGTTMPPSETLPAGGRHVLFIGNSLTYTNNLPRTVAELAQASGDTIRVLSVARPNFAVIDHALGMSDAVAVIQSQPWDYVVLQQGPTTTRLNRDTLILATKILDPFVKSAGGRTAVFMAWPHSAERHLFDAVRQSAMLASESVTQGVFLPIGEAWREALLADATVELYSGDGYHPGALGTYLSALVIYERVTGKDARALPARAVVGGAALQAPETTVRFLQRVAHETVARFSAGSAAVP